MLNQSENRDRRRRRIAFAASAAMTLALGGCSVVGNVWDGTRNTVGGLFGSDGEEQVAEAPPAADPVAAPAPAAPDTGGFVMGTGLGTPPPSDEGPPSLASVPSEAPVPPS